MSMYESLLLFAIQTAEKAGRVLLEHFKENEPISRGTPKEVKAMVDEIADEIIQKELEARFPDHSYLTEETGRVEKNSAYRWIIDPVDGTGNFVNSNPFYAISLFLCRGAEPVLGLIEAPSLQERYWAVKGEGAWVMDLETGERKRAQVSATRELQQSYLVCCEGGVKDRKRVLSHLDRYYAEVKDMRKLGSAALESAWVGLGRADAYITHEISIWDVAAGMLFVEEAGGVNLHFQGTPWTWDELLQAEELDLISSNGALELYGPASP